MNQDNNELNNNETMSSIVTFNSNEQLSSNQSTTYLENINETIQNTTNEPVLDTVTPSINEQLSSNQNATYTENITEPISSEQNIVNTSVNNEETNIQNDNISLNNNTNTKNNKKIIIIAIVCILLLGIIGFVVFKMFVTDKNASNGNSENSFFLSNKDGLYAIFNTNGKQLTDFIYKSNPDFINGSTEVRTNDGKTVIVSSDGKVIVDETKCKYISQHGPLYECKDNNYKYLLLTSKGEKILETDDIYVHSYIGEDKFAVVEDKTAKNITVYDYKGNSIVSFPISSNSKSPSVNSEDKYVSVFYNNKNYIIDISSSKLVLSFDDSQHFCVNAVNQENKNEITLNACTSFGSSVSKHEYKYVKDGKIMYTKSVDSSGNLLFEGNNVIFRDDKDKKYVLNEKGDIAFEITQYIQYISSNSYAKYQFGTTGIKRTRSDGTETYEKPIIYVNNERKYADGIRLYQDGKEGSLLPCGRFISNKNYAQQGIYLFSGCNFSSDGTYAFYKADGTKVGEKGYKDAESFDDNKVAIVSLDNTNYYMMNTKGEKISNDYKKISSGSYVGDKYYIGTKEDGTEDLINQNGKVLTSGKDIDVKKLEDKFYAIVEIDKQYELYDVNNEKSIAKLDKKPIIKDDYYILENNSKTEYYSYTTSQKFYEK